MRNLEDASWGTNNPPSTEEDDFVNPNETGEAVDKKLDAEVSGLFEDARDELEKIDANAERQKKEIVIDLAKDLEGKIPTDTICMEIINQLRGQVKERTVRACLDEKYKQKSQSENAKKQNRQQQQEVGSSDGSAASMPPNQETENKKAIILGVDGQAILQEEERDEQDDEGEDEEQSAVTTEPSITKDGVQKNHRQEQQEEPEDFKYSYDYLNMKGPSLEDLEPEGKIEKPIQSTDQDETAGEYIHNNKPHEPEGDILEFEFYMLYGNIRKYMVPLFQKIGDSGKVWIKGKIDRRTGKVVDVGFGKIS